VIEYSVRPASLDDAERIAEVHVSTWKTAYRGLLPDALLDSMVPEDRVSRWQRTLSDRDSTVLVAMLGSQVAGFLAIGPCRDDPDGTIGELDAIYILDEFSGLGIGSDFMRQSDRWMRNQGFSAAILWVLPTNERAIRFYELHGWRDDGAEKMLDVPGGSVPARRYRKQLA
jgi:GNAT superfamily N-acetyltransferase